VPNIAGRKGKSPETYADRPPSVEEAFGRNWGAGPESPLMVPLSPTFAAIEWDQTGAPGTSSSSIQITPLESGRVRVVAVVLVLNTTGSAIYVSLQLSNGATQFTAPIPQLQAAANGETAIPLVAEIFLQVGTQANIELGVSAASAGVEVVGFNSTIDIQELPAATG
jgi:hypothetical protein